MSSTPDSHHHYEEESEMAKSFTHEDKEDGSIAVDEEGKRDKVDNHDEAKPANNVEPGNAILALEAPPPVGLRQHYITVNTGEDISIKILTFCKQANCRMLCIISGSGDLSFVELNDPNNNGVMPYKGCFQILTLSGTFRQSESGGQLTTRGLTVSFARNDNQVFGGFVAGRLLAASQVHVVLGSFQIDKKKNMKSKSSEPR